MSEESAPRVAAAMAAGALTWGGSAVGVAGLFAGVWAGVAEADGPSAVVVVSAVLLGGAQAVGALAVGPRLLAGVGRVAEPGMLLVVALALYGFAATFLAGVAAWLLRWGALPPQALGLGVLTGTLAGTVGVVRGFARARVVTFSEDGSDTDHTGSTPPVC